MATVLPGCGGCRADIRMGLDGREELIRYITETRLDLIIGIAGQYLECFDSKSRFKLLNYICVSKLPTPEENDDDYDDDEDLPATKPQPSGRKARRSNATPKQKLVDDSKPIAPKPITPKPKQVASKLERFEVPPGYFKTAAGRFKDEITKKVYDIPPGFALTQDGLFVEDSEEEE
jgi:hypothetical protein